MKYALILFCIGFTFATIINIPEQYETIQQGIDSSTNGDTVLVQPGTYIENINFNGHNITLSSLFLTTQDTSYISQTIIDGNQNGSVVTFENGENSTTVITGFTLSGGYATDWETGGGGITCQNNSNPSLLNLRIINNYSYYGGGINCNNSNPSIIDVSITDNTAIVYGGGIYFGYDSNPFLSAVSISNNFAIDTGGGIYFDDDSNPFLSAVSISNNFAIDTGGGIYFDDDSNPVFSSENRCNIYSNIVQNRVLGSDIYSDSFVEVVVDTFTVILPSEYYASPLDNFSFDILSSIQEQVNADLFVSPYGDNSNDGLTPSTPLKTIQYALSIIVPDELNHLTITLADGIYSTSSNGEYFPIEMMNYISLVGESENGVILDAEQSASVIRFQNNSNSSLSNITITGGLAIYGAGIILESSNPFMSSLTISDNWASKGGGLCLWDSNPNMVDLEISQNGASDGGGLYLWDSNPLLKNVIINNNSSHGGSSHFYGGGGIFGSGSSPILINITLTDNFDVSGGSGVHFLGNSNPEFINSIIWNNIPPEIYMDDYNSTILLTYCDVEGGEAAIHIDNNCEVIWLEGNIDENPLFIDPDNGDYHLQPDSPCIDAGDPSSPLDPDGTTSDMGALYFNQGMICLESGDLTGDRILDILDVVQSMSCILYENGICLCADLDSSDFVDVLDIIIMIEIIIGI
jgi:hypothetical protein